MEFLLTPYVMQSSEICRRPFLAPAFTAEVDNARITLFCTHLGDFWDRYMFGELQWSETQLLLNYLCSLEKHRKQCMISLQHFQPP